MGDIILIVLMVVTLGVMLHGVVGMVRKRSPESQNKTMVWRVGLQAAALVVVAILLSVGKD